MGADKGRSSFPTVGTDSTTIRDPEPAHRAQAKYPGKNQNQIKNYYKHQLFDHGFFKPHISADEVARGVKNGADHYMLDAYHNT